MKAVSIRKALVIAAVCAADAGIAAEPGAILNFVACPVVQDTNMVPCWMAEYEGEKYFLGIQTDIQGWTPPLLGHQVLVEARVTDLPRICGGIVLESAGSLYDRRSSGTANGHEMPNPPVTSVMRELDSSCRTILPADDRYDNTIQARRGPGPSTPPPPRTPEELAAARSEAAARAEANKVVPPYSERTFEVYYEFDSELAGVTINALRDAFAYAETIKASAMEIVGYRSSVLLSNGQQLEELPYIAELRAKELEIALKMLGLPKETKLSVRWEQDLLKGNGVDDWTRRKAEIKVIP